MYRRRGRPQSRAARLTKEWVGFFTAEEPELVCPAAQVMSAAAKYAKWIIDPDSATALFDMPTILRMLIQYRVGADQELTLAGDVRTVAIGIMVVDGSEVAPGIIAPPVKDPLYRSYEDWLFWDIWQLVPAPSQGTTGFGSSTVPNKVWDMRGKRKIEAGAGLALYLSTPACNPALLQVAVNGRILIAH